MFNSNTDAAPDPDGLAAALGEVVEGGNSIMHLVNSSGGTVHAAVEQAWTPELMPKRLRRMLVERCVSAPYGRDPSQSASIVHCHLPPAHGCMQQQQQAEQPASPTLLSLCWRARWSRRT